MTLYLGSYVRAVTAQGSTHSEGRAIGYTDEPSYEIQRPDGTRFSWLARLCEQTDEPMAEPSVWAVVEAACVHDDTRRQWVRHPDGNWWEVGTYVAGGLSEEYARRLAQPDDWDSLVGPVLVRDGLES